MSESQQDPALDQDIQDVPNLDVKVVEAIQDVDWDSIAHPLGWRRQ